MVVQHEWMQGLCLSNHMLYREMSTRRSDVEREKEREKEKARLEKMQQVRLSSTTPRVMSTSLTLSLGWLVVNVQMAVSGSGGSSTYDPWAGAERRRHRSTDTAIDQDLLHDNRPEDLGKMAPLLVRGRDGQPKETEELGLDDTSFCMMLLTLRRTARSPSRASRTSSARCPRRYAPRPTTASPPLRCIAQLFCPWLIGIPVQALVERIQFACGSLSGHVDMRGPFKIRSTLPLDGAKVQSHIEVKGGLQNGHTRC